MSLDNSFFSSNLYLAILGRRSDKAVELIQNGANLDINQLGYNYLHLASSFGLVDVVIELLNAGMDIDSKEIPTGFTALDFATLENQTQVVYELRRRKSKKVL